MAHREARPRRRSDATPDQPHPFEAVDDSGLAAFALGGGGLAGTTGASPQSAAWATSTYIREMRCGFCGRPQGDPIHEVDQAPA